MSWSCETGSDVLPALQQLWSERVLSVQRNLVLCRQLCERDPLLDWRVAEGVSSAAEQRGVGVLVQGRGSPWRRITRRLVLLCGQRLNRMLSDPCINTHIVCAQEQADKKKKKTRSWNLKITEALRNTQRCTWILNSDDKTTLKIPFAVQYSLHKFSPV